MREHSESMLYIIMDKAVLLDPLTKSQWQMNNYYHLAHHFALVSLISFSILIQSVSSTFLSIFECLFNSNCALITSTLDSSNWMDFCWWLVFADGSLSDTALNRSLLDCQLPDRTTSSWRRGASSSASSSGGLAHSSSASQPQQLYAKNSDKGGLSKKSNSTSQLSATGQLNQFHFIISCGPFFHHKLFHSFKATKNQNSQLKKKQ